jgi:hypothetical protein
MKEFDHLLSRVSFVYRTKDVCSLKFCESALGSPFYHLAQFFGSPLLVSGVPRVRYASALFLSDPSTGEETLQLGRF